MNQHDRLIVSVIIVNFRQAKLTIRCIKQLLKSKGILFELIVIDNSCLASERRILEKVSSKKIIFVFSNKNVGCCKAYNIGVNIAKGKYVFILNNDTEIKDSSALKRMVSFMDIHSDVAVIQPKIKSLRNPEFFEYSGAAGGYIDIFGYPFCRGRLFQTVEEDIGQYNDSVPISWASTCAFFARKKYLIEAGLFDPIYFAYAEEIDMCLTLWKLGYRIVFFPKVEIFHLGEASWKGRRGRKTFLIHRNHLILYFKCFPLSIISRTIFHRFAYELISIVYYIGNKSSLHVPFVGLANLYCLIYISVILKKRINFHKPKQKNKFPIYLKSIVNEYFLNHKECFCDLEKNLIQTI